ncbi:MAG: hypothetical protein ACI935_003603 [Moritella dasanensis]|jgi:hypothetical protein
MVFLISYLRGRMLSGVAGDFQIFYKLSIRQCEDYSPQFVVLQFIN